MTTQLSRLSSVGGRSSSLFRIVLIALAVCCSANPVFAESGVSQSVDPDSPPSEIRDRGPTFPLDALLLLQQSSVDSCAVCSRKNRAEGFALLEAAYPSGTLLLTSATSQLIKIQGEENELAFSSYALEGPRLTFRFHSAEKHLVGVSTDDYTDLASMETYLSASVGQRFEGILELVGYPYGDGETFLYSPTQNHLQIQCRILDLAP